MCTGPWAPDCTRTAAAGTCQCRDHRTAECSPRPCCNTQQIYNESSVIQTHKFSQRKFELFDFKSKHIITGFVFFVIIKFRSFYTEGESFFSGVIIQKIHRRFLLLSYLIIFYTTCYFAEEDNFFFNFLQVDILLEVQLNKMCYCYVLAQLILLYLFIYIFFYLFIYFALTIHFQESKKYHQTTEFSGVLRFLRKGKIQDIFRNFRSSTNPVKITSVFNLFDNILRL